MNRIHIIGRLTANPELKTTDKGTEICTFNVAVRRKFDKDEIDFFPVTVWREVAKNCNKYLSKGSQVGVSGSIQIRRYEDEKGNKRIAVNLQAEEVEFLSSKSDTLTPANSKQTTNVDIDKLEEVDDGDMPF